MLFLYFVMLYSYRWVFYTFCVFILYKSLYAILNLFSQSCMLFYLSLNYFIPNPNDWISNSDFNNYIRFTNAKIFKYIILCRSARYALDESYIGSVSIWIHSSIRMSNLINYYVRFSNLNSFKLCVNYIKSACDCIWTVIMY